MTVAGVTLKEATRGLRGKGNKDKTVTFLEIDDTLPRPTNVMDAVVAISSEISRENFEQELWDRFVLGYNAKAYEAVADPLADYIDSSWDADKTKNFRATVNAMAKLTNRDKTEVAEELLKSIS